MESSRFDAHAIHLARHLDIKSKKIVSLRNIPEKGRIIEWGLALTSLLWSLLDGLKHCILVR